MANNFHLVTFPILNTKLGVTLHFKIHGNEGRCFTLPFTFKILTNSFVEKEFPTVLDFVNEINKVLVNRILPLLGKNVQLTSIILNNETLSFTIPQYVFGTSQKNALAEPYLYFGLQTTTGKKDLRFYLRGSSVAFHKQPLQETERGVIEAFELVFISTLILFSEKLKLRYIKESEEDLIACNFRGLYIFQKKVKPTKIAKAKSKIKVKKVVKTPVKRFSINPTSNFNFSPA